GGEAEFSRQSLQPPFPPRRGGTRLVFFLGGRRIRGLRNGKSLWSFFSTQRRKSSVPLLHVLALIGGGWLCICCVLVGGHSRVRGFALLSARFLTSECAVFIA